MDHYSIIKGKQLIINGYFAPQHRINKNFHNTMWCHMGLNEDNLWLFRLLDQYEEASVHLWDLMEGKDKVVAGTTCELMPKRSYRHGPQCSFPPKCKRRSGFFWKRGFIQAPSRRRVVGSSPLSHGGRQLSIISVFRADVNVCRVLLRHLRVPGGGGAASLDGRLCVAPR